jgi:hypothetical protein
MLLDIKRRGKKGIFQVSGTVAGVRVRRSLAVDTREDAEVAAHKIEREILDEAVHGKPATVTFAKAVKHYKDKGGSPRFLWHTLEPTLTARLVNPDSRHVFQRRPLPISEPAAADSTAPFNPALLRLSHMTQLAGLLAMEAKRVSVNSMRAQPYCVTHRRTSDE